MSNDITEIKAIMKYVCENTETDEWRTSNKIEDVVLVATVNEFIVCDKDKFKLLEISKHNTFLV